MGGASALVVDVCSPLRVPLETTLPESEVCHSKLQRTKTPEEKSFSREEAKSTLQAETSDSHERRLQANRSSSSVCTPLAITARDTAPADGPSRLTVTIASPRRKSSRLEALSGRTRSQRELFTNNVAHSSIENGDTASFSHALEVNSHLSVPKKSYADAPQDTNGNKVAECNFNPKADACEVSMQTNASLSMSRLNNASFLDMLLQDSQPEVKDSDSTAAGRLSQQDKVTLSAETSCGAVKPRFSQEEKVRCSVTSNTTPHQNGNKQKRSTGLSLVRWTKEDTRKQSSGKSTDDAEKCEVNIVAEDKLHVEVFNPCDDDSRDSQQELFVHEDEPDVIVEDAPLKVMAEDKGGINEQPVKEGTKMTEKQCNTDKAPDPSESHSPMRKRRRTRSYEPTTITADTKDTNYNFRKRKLSYSPFWKKRMSRESKTIASAFSKLIQGALKTPISMFALNFEQFGLAECAEAKGLPTDPDSASQREKSRLTVDDNTSSERSSPGRSEACLQIEPYKRASTESSKSQHPSLSSPSITRCGKMEGSGKPEHVSRDKSSEDAADTCDHAIPVLPKSEHSSCLDLQGSSELAERMPPLSSSDLACKGEEESSQEAEDTDADRSTALRGESSSIFPEMTATCKAAGKLPSWVASQPWWVPRTAPCFPRVKKVKALRISRTSSAESWNAWVLLMGTVPGSHRGYRKPARGQRNTCGVSSAKEQSSGQSNSCTRTAFMRSCRKSEDRKDSHRSDRPSASGHGDVESRSSEKVDDSQIKAVEEGHSDSSEKDKSTEHDSESCNRSSQNESAATMDLPAEPVAESAEEVTAAEGDQCSQSLSSSLQPLSGLSNFMEEDVGDGELAELSELERNNEPQEIGSPEHRMSEPDDCWGDEDGGRPDQDCMDAKDEGGDCKTLSDSSLVLGTKRPLLFFCELKCATKQPVSRVFVVRATPRPFLVSVQAGAVNVWHLEKTWRHTLVAGNIKWSVLVYLSPRQVPLQLPCVLWDARDGRHCCQLLLTLGEKGSATTEEDDSPSTTTKGGLCIYRLARLSGCEGQFVSALKTASGATLLRVHRVRCFRGEFGDETEFLGRTSNLLDSLVPVEGLPSALLGNHANIFYVWATCHTHFNSALSDHGVPFPLLTIRDCENRVLVKKMVLEPDLFADMRHISWCCSEKGLLFALMRSLDDVTSTLVAMNPFSCKAEPVCSASWKPAARARVDDSRVLAAYFLQEGLTYIEQPMFRETSPRQPLSLPES
ncbi:hypothetical protein HPB48_016408 [Haemaphysalis longicornis]|uniref:Uncharacterized protein n=1 Tax=Haemaphysalis longicornis TaxID=44386 RepID=A0A9J6FFD4_HAELO|nr:hypothetical protein HPB48_016408 [Haemaphysalis longicornis]